MEEPKATRAPVIPQEDASSPFLKIPEVRSSRELLYVQNPGISVRDPSAPISPRRDDKKNRLADDPA